MILCLVGMIYVFIGLVMLIVWTKKGVIDVHYKLTGMDKFWVVICWLPIVMLRD